MNGDIINTTQLTKMQTIDAAANNYGLGMEFSVLGSQPYHGHYGEVANSSALYHSLISSALAPNGYFIAYNFNTQGASMQVKMNVPIYKIMMSNVGIEEIMASKDILLFPNPAKNKLTVCLMNQAVKDGTIEVMDLQGRILKTCGQTPFSLNTEIDLEEFEAGTYVLSFKSGLVDVSHRFIVE
jgi:hypothetical protein